MTDERKDLPPVNSPNFLEKVREALSVYLGNRGDGLDRGLTLRDLTEAGIVTLRSNFGRGNTRNPIDGPGSAIIDISGEYEVDLTPPPTPTGFTAAAGITNLLLECDPQTYTQGHGHAKSKLHGATWTAGPLPVFADAVVITEFSGTVASHATNPATTWHLWLTWVTVDGVESTTPAGGTNGVVTRTGEDVALLLEALTGEITESQLYANLGSRIDLIDTPTTGLVDSLAAAKLRLNAVDAPVTGLISQLADANAAIALAAADADAALASILDINSAIADLQGTPDYAAGTTYAIGDKVKYDGNIYQATAATTGNLPTNTAFWTNIGAYVDSAALAAIVDGHTTSITTLDGVTTALTTQSNLLASQVETSLSGLTAEQLTRATGDSALSSQVVTLVASTAAGAAGLQVEQKARSDASAALAQQVTTLVASMGGNTAGLTVEQQARADATSALSSQLTTLVASTGASLAGLTVEQTARADATGALASQLTTLLSLTGANAASIVQSQQTAATADSALAERATTLEAAVNNPTTGLSATAGALDAVKLTVDNATTGVVATATKTSVLETRSNRVVNYRIQAKGGSATIGTTGFFSETGVALAPVTRSYMLVVLDASTGAYVSGQTYDVYGDGAFTGGRNAATLATDLNALSSSVVVVVFTTDEPMTNRLTGGLPAALYRCGASRVVFESPTFRSRSAYLMVGIPGIGEGMGVEKYVGAITNDPGAWVDYQLQLINGRPVALGGNPTAAAITSEATTRASEDGVLSNRIDTVSATLDQNTALVQTVQTASATADTTIASQLTTVKAALDGNMAGLQVEQSARATESSALASQLTTLVASTGASAAALVTSQQVSSTADAALSSQLSTLVAQTGASLAGITSAQEASTTADSALALRATTLESAVTDLNTGLASKASIAYVDQAEADAISASATSIQQLQSKVTAVRKWEKTTVVNGSSAALITSVLFEDDGVTPLRNADQIFGASKGEVTYTVSARVTTTGTQTGSVSVFTSTWNGSTWVWTQLIVKEAGTSSNHVQLYLNGGVPSIRLYDHATSYGVTYNVECDVGGFSSAAAVKVEATTRATQTGELYAQYTVKLDVGGKVSGYGLASSSTSSEFAIRADRFYIAPPSGSAVTTDIIPFAVQATATTINGVAVPAGVYINDAYVKNGTITNAKIGNAAIDDAKISDLSATKITAGSIGVGSYISSTAYTAGSAGWRINADGTAEFSGVVVRGTVFATAGQIGGITIASNAVRAGQTAYNTGTGFYLGANGTFSLGNSAGNRLTWDGTNLNVVGGGTFSGALSAATGSFAGSLSAATGSFSGSLSAATGTFSGNLSAAGGTFAGALSAASGTFSGTLTASAINAVNTLNIGGGAVTETYLASSGTVAGNTGCSYTVNIPAGQTHQVTTIASITGQQSWTTTYGISVYFYLQLKYAGANVDTYTKYYSVSGSSSTATHTVLETATLQHTAAYTGPTSVVISVGPSSSVNPTGAQTNFSRLMVLVTKR